jgi:hypothetical protein
MRVKFVNLDRDGKGVPVADDKRVRRHRRFDQRVLHGRRFAVRSKSRRILMSAQGRLRMGLISELRHSLSDEIRGKARNCMQKTTGCGNLKAT